MTTAKAVLVGIIPMTAKEFEESLRELLNQKPFQPFVVEYNDGERFEVDGPFVAFSGGNAGFLGPNDDFHFFDYTTVKQFDSSQEIRS